MDIFRAYFKPGKYLSAMARIPADEFDAAIDNSGIDAVSIWEERPPAGQEAKFRALWLPQGTTLTGAFQAAGMSDLTRGVLCKEDRVGVRVPNSQFTEACAAILGEEEAQRLSGTIWRVHGLPISWGKAAMESALKSMKWAAIAERPSYDARQRCRVWIIRSNDAPPVQTLDFEVGKAPATINRLEATRRRQTGPNRDTVYSWAGRRATKPTTHPATVSTRAAPPAPAAPPRAPAWKQGENLRTVYPQPNVPAQEAWDVPTGGASDEDDEMLGNLHKPKKPQEVFFEDEDEHDDEEPTEVLRQEVNQMFEHMLAQMTELSGAIAQLRDQRVQPPTPEMPGQAAPGTPSSQAPGSQFPATFVDTQPPPPRRGRTPTRPRQVQGSASQDQTGAKDRSRDRPKPGVV